MKFVHLSDLHIGKKLNEFSLHEDQEYILNQIYAIICDQKPQAVIIAGDVYDKAIPSAEAVLLFDEFLTKLADAGFVVLVISGNHDSAERLSFGASLMRNRGVHIANAYDGGVQACQLQDEFGPVNFYLLPFVKPVHVKHTVEEKEAEQIASYHDAVKLAIERLPLNPQERNVLVAHQFVTGAEKCDSEDIAVGGIDNIGAEVFAPFVYTALGHIHSPQNVGGSEGVRYCGTPLKYSFSECNQTKSVTVVELGEGRDLKVSTVPLEPLHEVRKLRGSYDELTLRSNYENPANGRVDDFLSITLTDEEDVTNAMAKLRAIYPNLLHLEYDNTRTRNSQSTVLAKEIEHKTPMQLFEEFYLKMNGSEMQDCQKDFVQDLLDKLNKDEVGGEE